jgi:hypothetical protein
VLQPSYQITAAASNKSECYQTTPGCVGGWPCNVEGRVGGFMGIWIRGYGWTGLGTVTCNYAQTLFRFVRSGKWRVNIIFEKTELCNEGMAPMWRSKLTCIACMFFLARQSISANFWFSQFKCRSAPPKPESIWVSTDFAVNYQINAKYL